MVGCCNLGRLPDGTRGCLGHQTIKNPELPERELCKNLICLPDNLNNPRGLKRISEAILANPPGEFKMSVIFSWLKQFS
jgi:hypothetical protein